MIEKTIATIKALLSHPNNVPEIHLHSETVIDLLEHIDKLQQMVDASLPIANIIQEAEWIDELGIEYMVLTVEFDPKVAAEFITTIL